MSETDVLDVVRRLIVGKRGRGRADRLVCFSADNQRRTISVKPQTNASRYADMVAGCNPVRVEAYAGEELVDSWGEPVSPAPARKPAKQKTSPAPAPSTLKKKRNGIGEVKDLSAHIATLFGTQYTNHSRELAGAHKTNADRDEKLWEHLVQVAQHHSDRAGHAEARAVEAEKAVRLRDKQILELHQTLLRMQQKIAEIAADTSGGDRKTEAFMKLLGMVKENPLSAAVAATTNGAPAKKGKES